LDSVLDYFVFLVFFCGKIENDERDLNFFNGLYRRVSDSLSFSASFAHKATKLCRA